MGMDFSKEFCWRVRGVLLPAPISKTVEGEPNWRSIASMSVCWASGIAGGMPSQQSIGRRSGAGCLSETESKSCGVRVDTVSRVSITGDITPQLNILHLMVLLGHRAILESHFAAT